jgi:SAM-dependent methyltransferase
MGADDVTGDLLHQREIKDLVRDAYAGIDAGAGRAGVERFYGRDVLSTLPPEAVGWALGVGNPVPHAALAAGETVLDVGCGAGIDTILAARAVGERGRAIGLDVLEEMCERARRHAREARVDDRTRFVRGEMEDMPLPDASVDVVVSNGVINPRKSRVLAEIRRVLRPGGRIAVADLTVDEELPPEVRTSDAAWAG